MEKRLCAAAPASPPAEAVVGGNGSDHSRGGEIIPLCQSYSFLATEATEIINYQRFWSGGCFQRFNQNIPLEDMSIVQGPQSRGTTGGSSHSHTTPLPFANEFTKTLTRSSARFGALSHHSFFSRHNPHPNRVRHIQGLNGRPVCMVRDDWFVTSSLFPHPLLRSQILRKAANPSFASPLASNLNGVSGPKHTPGLFSEAWRDELKELAVKVSLSSRAQKDKKEEIPEEECVRRQTQYSAETGRILPPPTKSYQRRSHSQRQIHPQPFHDQELMVLELLCQILQTDSLSTVQQWLLLAGQREKELVMGMIRRALDGVDVSGHHQTNLQQLQALHPGASPPAYGPSFQQPWRKPPRTSDDKPVRIGGAEVLEVHAGADLQEPPLQHMEGL
ncbi:protein TBATA isoform X2 [Scophthalmus maximus]|uniref:protein TBATA isoform X2 n=1 Tax=Scophthalmus maximus TaxID=52904 RepID=UPI001FA89B5F|nr:protein TBATA isoform X2 [Scophthalmus maximus]